jgi:hypothetical protein
MLFKYLGFKGFCLSHRACTFKLPSSSIVWETPSLVFAEQGHERNEFGVYIQIGNFYGMMNEMQLVMASSVC